MLNFPLFSADGKYMTLAQVQNEVFWIVVALIAAWMVIMILRQVAGEVDHAIRRHNLHVEAKMLRNRQAERLRAISEFVE